MTMNVKDYFDLFSLKGTRALERRGNTEMSREQEVLSRLFLGSGCIGRIKSKKKGLSSTNGYTSTHPFSKN